MVLRGVFEFKCTRAIAYASIILGILSVTYQARLFWLSTPGIPSRVYILMGVLGVWSILMGWVTLRLRKCIRAIALVLNDAGSQLSERFRAELLARFKDPSKREEEKPH